MTDAPSGPIAGIVLAAGASTRFGSPKQLSRFGTSTVLETTVSVARAGGLDPLFVVLPTGIACPAGVSPVWNDEPERGMSHSLRLGLAAVPAAAADAAVVLLGDQPTLDPGIVRRLRDARGATRIIAARSHDRFAPPVLLERAAFRLADGLSGNAGLRDWLEGNAERVTAVEVPEHAPDVDTPADLVALLEPCPGCGARLPAVRDGATHAYIGASPACWAAYGELLAAEFSDPAAGRWHRHTADIYAAQHPGREGRRQRQSVAAHLVAICAWLEHGATPGLLNPMTQRLAMGHEDWPWLPPPTTHRVTVLDVLEAASTDEQGARVHRWGEAVWDAWSEHHATVRRWTAEALRGGG